LHIPKSVRIQEFPQVGQILSRSS